MTRLRLLVALGCGAILSACGGSGNSGPVAGSLTVTYSSPNSDDGAVLFAIGGAQIDSVSLGAYTGYVRKVNTDSVVVVVAGHPVSGALVTFAVPDKNAAASYHARITQVAQRGTYAQRALTGYGVTVGP